MRLKLTEMLDRGGPPGNRTLNLRIKSLIFRRSASWAFAHKRALTCALGSWSFIVLHGCLWASRGLVAAQKAQNRNPSSLCQGEGRQFESGRPLLAKRAWDLQLSHLRGQLLMRSVS